jgi:threonine/homoserine/homoserine lactone efflux protein
MLFLSANTIGYTGTIVQWIVPATGAYTIVARGASGGFKTGCSGGAGASMQGVFSLVAGQVLSILVGQRPPSPIGYLKTY